LSWTVCGYRRVALLNRIEHPANIAGDYRADIYRTAAPELMGFRKDGPGINAWGYPEDSNQNVRIISGCRSPSRLPLFLFARNKHGKAYRVGAAFPSDDARLSFRRSYALLCMGGSISCAMQRSPEPTDNVVHALAEQHL